MESGGRLSNETGRRVGGDDGPSPHEATGDRRARAFWSSVALGTVLFALANALLSAWVGDWTYDEPFHLEWSELLLTHRVADRSSQHFNAKTPALVPNVLARMAARRVSPSEQALRFVSRLPSVLWLLGLLAAVFLVGRQAFGTEAGCMATAAAALDPNLAAHGSVATVDVAYALATLLTVAGAISFGRRPSPERAAHLGLALGLALSVKYSAVLLLPVLLLLPALARPARSEWRRWIVGALVVGATAAATVCAAYLFLDVATPLGAHRWVSRPLARLASFLPGLRLPLPDGFLTGLDASLAAERGDWNVVILGRLYPHGVWFYFAALWALKTPVLVLLAEAYGLWRAARGVRAVAPFAVPLLLAALLVHLGYFSLMFRTQVGYRFVLMCVPLACLLAASGLAPLAGHRSAPALAAVVAAVAVAENGMYLGNPLAFTNACVWPKRQAFRLLADSNLDWGQNDEKIQRWLATHPGSATGFNPPHLLPGRNILGVNEAAGVSDFERHRFLRESLDPVSHFRHSYLFFDVDDSLFDRFLTAQRSLVPRPDDEAACSAVPDGEGLSATAEAHLFLPGPPRTCKTWIVCVRSPRGVDFSLRARAGQLRLGRYQGGVACDGEIVGAGQRVWYRLEAGAHALCAAELSDLSWTAHPFEGSWVVARGEAAVHMRVDADRFAALDSPPSRRRTR